MKKLVWGVLCLSLFSSSTWAERRGDQGYGIMVGNPSGFTAKYWLDSTWALDAMIGVARSEFDIHGDVLYHFNNWAKPGTGVGNAFKGITKRGDFPLYVGGGVRVLFEHKTEVGIRIPAGASFMPFNSPWEFFAEIAPVIRLTPSVGMNGDYSIGVRYTFRGIRPITKSPEQND